MKKIIALCLLFVGTGLNAQNYELAHGFIDSVNVESAEIEWNDNDITLNIDNCCAYRFKIESVVNIEGGIVLNTDLNGSIFIVSDNMIFYYGLNNEKEIILKFRQL